MRIHRWIGLGVARVLLLSGAAVDKRIGIAQPQCTVTVQPGQPIQQAIDGAADGAVS